MNVYQQYNINMINIKIMITIFWDLHPFSIFPHGKENKESMHLIQ